MTQKPILKVGIISDIQGYPYKADWGFYNLEKTLQVLADKNIDILLNAGDIGDNGNDTAAIAYYMELVKKYFPQKLPPQVACLGNHDFEPRNRVRSQEDCLNGFFDALGETKEQVQHKVVGGFDFIALSSNLKHNYDKEDCEKLRPFLDKAVARDPSKPIFVITHYHPGKTVEASFGRDGSESLRTLLNGYPQVISFSGHSHSPLTDERCIWQGEFTAINTSGLSYCCVPEKYANGCGPIPPFAREGLFFMYMEIFEDHVKIHRYNAEDQEEIKPKMAWVIKTPYKPSEATYTDKRAKTRKAPVFPENSQLILRYDYGFAYLVFEQAKHDDFVHYYRVVITPIESDIEGTPIEFRFIGNFYRTKQNRDTRLVFRMPPNTLEAGKRYRIELYPVETFGNEGAPLSIDIVTVDTYKFRNVAEIGPQE